MSHVVLGMDVRDVELNCLHLFLHLFHEFKHLLLEKLDLIAFIVYLPKVMILRPNGRTYVIENLRLLLKHLVERFLSFVDAMYDYYTIVLTEQALEDLFLL